MRDAVRWCRPVVVGSAVGSTGTSATLDTFQGAGRVWKNLGDYLNTHATLVTAIWLFCLAAQLVRLTGGLYRIRRFRTSKVYPPASGWGDRLNALRRTMGIRRQVILLQSELVVLPVTFGFLK